MKEIKQNLTMSNDNTLHATLSLRDRFKLKIFKVHDVKRHGNDTLLLKISTEDLHARGSYATQSIQLTEDSDLMDFKPALIRLVNERLRSLLQEQMQQQMQQFRNSFPAINGATPLTMMIYQYRIKQTDGGELDRVEINHLVVAFGFVLGEKYRQLDCIHLDLLVLGMK
jgi:hypothetical protein